MRSCRAHDAAWCAQDLSGAIVLAGRGFYGENSDASCTCIELIEGAATHTFGATIEQRWLAARIDEHIKV